MLSPQNLQEEFELSQSQIAKMEQIVKERSTRLQRRKSLVDKRGSIKLKNLNRQSCLFSKDELTTVETLATYFENVEGNLELIDEFCFKKKINFLIEIKSKMSSEEYKSFLSNLQLYRVPEGGRLQQEGKFHSFHYIILDGHLGVFHEKKIKDQENECLQMFEYQVGEVVISNLLQTHKANPYTIKAKRSSLLLRFSDEVYIKFLKKIYLKEMDELATLLNHTLVFKGISVAEIKKFLPYCSIRRYRYNQLVYDEGELIKQLFLILEGEVEISYDFQDQHRNKASKTSLTPPIVPHNYYKTNHQSNDKKQIKVVRVGRKELFGLEAYEVFNENYYEHHARVTSDSLKTLAIGLDVIYDIELENPILEENLNSYLKKINQIHNRLLQKSQNINLGIPQQPKKKKKKRKLRRRPQNSLEWWGLAAKIEDSKKYRLPPPPPKSQSAKNLIRKQPLQILQRTSKLDYFKRRLFEDQMQALEAISQKQNSLPFCPGGLVPKLQKMKIKMINSQPKVINNADRVKKKLVQYAKNGQVFCDKLQLE